MKTAITFLGIALLGIATANAATSVATTTNKTAKVALAIENEQGSALEANAIAEEGKGYVPVEDQTILNPEMALNTSFQKTMEDVIVADNQIIESNVALAAYPIDAETTIESIIQENNQIIESENANEVHPLYLERTIEDVIAEDNAIIESTIALVAQPLDFDAINKKSSMQKQNTIKLADRIQL